MTITTTCSALLAAATATFACACNSEPAPKVSTTQAQAAAPDPGAPTGHYCNMNFFTTETRARHDALVPKMAAAVSETEELTEGYAFKLSGEVRETGEFLDGVRGCCPTIRYDVTFSPRSGPVTVRMTGGAGAKEFIREEFGLILAPKKG